MLSHPLHSQWQLLRHRGNSSEGGDKHYQIDTKDIRRNLSIRSSLGPGMRIRIPISFFGLSDKNKSENAGLKFSTCLGHSPRVL